MDALPPTAAVDRRSLLRMALPWLCVWPRCGLDCGTAAQLVAAPAGVVERIGSMTDPDDARQEQYDTDALVPGGIAHGQTHYVIDNPEEPITWDTRPGGLVWVTNNVVAPIGHGAITQHAMSQDAGSTAETNATTGRRQAWNALGSMRQDEIRQKVGELLVEYRNKSYAVASGPDGHIEKILAAVLDT